MLECQRRADHGNAVPVASLVEIELPEGCLLGVGSPASGTAGFRQSHQQAAASYLVAKPERPAIGYREIALEDLASRNAEAAATFVAAELGTLDGEDQRSQRLRETLISYFACGDNARATAARLGVHPQTVGQRLETIEERIGEPIPQRWAELEVALRLRAHQATDVSQG